jgi:hypothetical protein
MKRLLWLVLAFIAFIVTNATAGFWIEDAGWSISDAIRHFMDAAHSDWLLVSLLIHTGVFTIAGIAWWLREMRRRGWSRRRRGWWIVALVVLGAPALLAWLAADRDDAPA